MTFSVIVHSTAGQFEASLAGVPDVRATAPTRIGALAALEAVIEKRVEQGELVTLEIGRQGLAGLFGKYRDDPTLQDICDEAYRERDADVPRMKAFDTDILTQILLGNPAYAERVAQIPIAEQSLPIVVAEEMVRGRFNAIRQAESGKAKITIEQAYQFFERTLKDIRELTILSYTQQAEAQYQMWRKQKLRGSSHDLRIAAICIAHAVTLVTRNRRDFEQIQGLSVEFWE